MENGTAAGISVTAADGVRPDPAVLSAAVSKLISASIGDICVVMSRAAAHKHYSLADIEWKVLPAVLAGQFYIADAAAQDGGFRAPIAFVTWARVSAEVDQRLTETAGQLRLRPEEWTSGEISWLIDAVGDPRGLNVAFRWLESAPFKERRLKVIVRDASGAPTVDTLDCLIADAKAVGGGAVA